MRTSSHFINGESVTCPGAQPVWFTIEAPGRCRPVRSTVMP